ncbi:MAG: AurF N-oxygenase family protein [Microthrixaceae bacterium]
MTSPVDDPGATLAATGEERARRFRARLGRLSARSTGATFDAFRDIDWNHPTMAVDVTDPRFILGHADPLGAHDWYLALPLDERARIGALRVAACVTTAWQFENLLQQGLLHRALHLRGQDEEFRYLHHEIIEESQHTLMFHEFVRRTGFRVRGMPWALRTFTEVIIGSLARWSPGVFFVMVLGGEDPVDLVNHQILESGHPHPLLERIMGIHIAEEARHISYARAALHHEVPRLGRVRRTLLSVIAPFALGIMVRLMVLPGRDVVRGGPVPRQVVRAAYRSEQGRRLYARAVARPRRTLRELGVDSRLGHWTWRAFGIWDPDEQV